MPKLMCRCGEALRYGEIPCQIEWLLISDTQFDQLDGSVDAEDLYRKMKSLLKCSRCGRLWAFWQGFDKEAAEYVPVGRAAGVAAD